MLERKFCVILGSGESINQLTPEQLDFINSQPVRIGLNKYSAYFHKAQITPTHVYFTDIFSEASRNYLQLIFRKLTDLDLGPTYILNKKVRYRATKNRLGHKVLKLAYWLPNLFLITSRLYCSCQNQGHSSLSGIRVGMTPVTPGLRL